MRTKLLILTPSAIVYGGVERIVESLNDGLANRGLDVVVGLAKGARFHDSERYRRAYPKLNAIEIDATTGTSEGRRRAVRMALDRVRPDIVLIARMASAFEVLAERKLRGENIRVVLTVQSYEPNYFADVARYGAFVDYCVAGGRLIGDALIELLGFPANRVRSIPAGIRKPGHFVVRQNAASVRLGYVGRLDNGQKRILDLPAILKALANRRVQFSCTIAGEGPEEDDLRRLISELGLSDRVRSMGACDQTTLYRDVYPNIDVFLHCAAWEGGFPGAPREAMAHGTVLVSSRFRSLAHEGMFVDGVNARTFPVGDVQRAAELVAELARDPEQWKRLSQAALKSQEGIRSYEGALDAWAECFRRVLELPSRRGAAVPVVDRQPAGRLDRLFGEKSAETIRRLLGRKYRHAEQGGEWPHWTGVDDPEFRRRVEEFARQVEDQPAPVGAAE